MTLWSSDSDQEALEELKKLCYRVVAFRLTKWRSLYNCIAALPSSTPLQAVYSWQPELEAEIVDMISDSSTGTQYDAIHIEHLRGVRYGINLNSYFSKNKLRIPIIWDSVDCISLLFEQAALKSRVITNRIITRLELPRTRKSEGWLVDQFSQIIISSRIDKEALLKLTTHGDNYDRISIIPNGVDLNYFSFQESINRESATLVFSGKMSYHANISMVLYLVNDIMPIIWAARPGVKLWIVGKDPPKIISSLSQIPEITVTGTVEDIRPYLQRATVALVPLTYGAGSQLKLLEGMASGTPIVATSRAVSALSTLSGKDLLIGDDPVQFAKQVLHLLNDDDLRFQIGRNGRRYVEKNHNWEVISKHLEDVYKLAIKNNIV